MLFITVIVGFLGLLVLIEYLYYLGPRPHNLSKVGVARNTGTDILAYHLLSARPHRPSSTPAKPDALIVAVK